MCWAVIPHSVVRVSVFQAIINRLTGSISVWIPSPTVFAPTTESDSQFPHTRSGLLLASGIGVLPVLLDTALCSLEQKVTDSGTDET